MDYPHLAKRESRMLSNIDRQNVPKRKQQNRMKLLFPVRTANRTAQQIGLRCAKLLSRPTVVHRHIFSNIVVDASSNMGESPFVAHLVCLIIGWWKSKVLHALDIQQTLDPSTNGSPHIRSRYLNGSFLKFTWIVCVCKCVSLWSLWYCLPYTNRF